MDDEDDIYPDNEPQTHYNNRPEVKMEDIEYDEEEGEEVEDDDSDDEINFITDTKEESKADGSLQPTTQGSQPKRPIAITADQRKPSTSQTPVPGLKREHTPQPTIPQLHSHNHSHSHTHSQLQSQLQPQSQSQSQSQSQTQPQARARQTSSQPTYQQQAHHQYDDSTSRPGSSYPARHTSTLDLNANPIHPATGKTLFSTDLDVDFQGTSTGSVVDGQGGEDTKPWRKPGADVTDYFNYGFDEFTWASYCLKKQDMNKEVKEIRDGAESMKTFLEGFGGMPGMPAMAGAPNGPGAGAGVNGPNGQGAVNPAGAGAGGMPGMPSEADMQQMFQGMMAQGIDPSTMDPSQFMQMMMGGAGGQAGFGGNQPPSGPAMGFGGGGFDQGGGGGGFQQGGGGGGGGGGTGGGSGGGGRGRGRRGRGNW